MHNPKRAVWRVATAFGIAAIAAEVLLATSAAAAQPAIGALAAGDVFPDTASLLRPAGWEPANRTRIIAFLQARGCHSAGYDPQAPPAAVFDWDNTSIFNNLGDAAFNYQVRTLCLKLLSAELAAVLPQGSSDKTVSFAAQRQEALDAYQRLENAGLVGQAAMRKSWSAKSIQLQQDPQLRLAYEVLRYRLIWFYEMIDRIDGGDIGCQWLARLFAGFTPRELGQLMTDVLAYELRDPRESQLCRALTIAHPDPRNAPGGQRSALPIAIASGIVATPEIRDLMAAMRGEGFDVYVVTASYAGAVAPLAAEYGVPADHVIGTRLALKADGSCSDQVITPIPYSQGKVDNIRKFLPRPPVFVAGDSDGDVPMLQLPSVELRLIVHRNLGGDIARLQDKARTDPDRYLLQGRNDYTPAGTARGTWNGLNRSTAR